MKKAFCEPENIGFCPPITLANVFASSEIEIKRSPENGGDVIYKNQADMETDFEKGTLHPGDLKATASAIMVAVLDRISTEIKGDKDASKACKALKAFVKKMSKKKKK